MAAPKFARTPLPDAAVQQALTTLPGWHLQDGALTCSYEFADFSTAWAFLSRLALLSEQLDHHAEIWNVYHRVRVRLSTHEPPGISQMDVEMAGRLCTWAEAMHGKY